MNLTSDNIGRDNTDLSTYSLSQDCRPSDNLPLEKLARYLLSTIPSFMAYRKLIVFQFPNGSSNITYQLSNGHRQIILRKPPKGTKAKSAHDMVREHSILSSIYSYYSLSPKPLLLCEDKEIIGDRFFIMEKISGVSIQKDLPSGMTIKEQQNLCDNFVSGLVRLHEIDITSSALEKLGKPEGYSLRQLEGWQARYLKAMTPDSPSCDKIGTWLNRNLPVDSKYQSLIHNDYKFDNLVLDPDFPQSIIGVLDWEMATLGNPLMDLGCSLAYWVESSDNQTLQKIRMMPTHLPGMMTRQQIFDAYCKQRNISDVEMLPYYIFGLFRLAVIAQQIYFRFYHKQTDNPKFSHFDRLVGILIKQAEKQI